MIRHVSRRKKGDGRVPTDSIADIAFLLIIFFLVATTLVQTRGVVTDMPAGERSEDTQQADDKTPIVNLNSGALSFNDRSITLPLLEQELRNLRLHEKEGPEKVILFEATGQVSYQQYYEVMTMIAALGGVIALVSE